MSRNHEGKVLYFNQLLFKNPKATSLVLSNEELSGTRFGIQKFAQIIFNHVIIFQ